MQSHDAKTDSAHKSPETVHEAPVEELAPEEQFGGVIDRAPQVGAAALPPNARNLLQLQRTIGNRSVMRLMSRPSRTVSRRADDFAVAHNALRARLPSVQRVAASTRALGQPPQISQRSGPGRIHRCPIGSKDKADTTDAKPPPELWSVVNQEGEGYGSVQDPSVLADQLSEQSESFASLRGSADKAVKSAFGEKKGGVTYNAKPKKGGGTGPAYYKDGGTFYNTGGHPAEMMLNIVFETANASQAVQFKQVESDYKKGLLDKVPKKQLSDYGIDEGQLSSELQGEYRDGTPMQRRSLIQECFEWNSLQIARQTFDEIKGKFGGEIPKTFWETSFGQLMGMKSFMEYYAFWGRTHRSSVQQIIEKAEPR